VRSGRSRWSWCRQVGSIDALGSHVDWGIWKDLCVCVCVCVCVGGESQVRRECKSLRKSEWILDEMDELS
jgi:hypothetical protein